MLLSSIAIFAVDAQTGLLTSIGYQSIPHQFSITPNGRYLLCCYRDSNKIQVFRRDTATGFLADTIKTSPSAIPSASNSFNHIVFYVENK